MDERDGGDICLSKQNRWSAGRFREAGTAQGETRRDEVLAHGEGGKVWKDCSCLSVPQATNLHSTEHVACHAPYAEQAVCLSPVIRHSSYVTHQFQTSTIISHTSPFTSHARYVTFETSLTAPLSYVTHHAPHAIHHTSPLEKIRPPRLNALNTRCLSPAIRHTTISHRIPAATVFSSRAFLSSLGLAACCSNSNTWKNKSKK